MSMKQRVSRQGAKALRTAKASRTSRCASIFARLCVFAALRELSIGHGIVMIPLGAIVLAPTLVFAQTTLPDSIKPQAQPALSLYLDQTNGLTAGEAVAYALAHNGELAAARKEI